MKKTLLFIFIVYSNILLSQEVVINRSMVEIPSNVIDTVCFYKSKMSVNMEAIKKIKINGITYNIGELHPIEDVISISDDSYIAVEGNNGENVVLITDNGILEQRRRVICDNLVQPTMSMSTSTARGLFTMIPSGAEVDNFSFYPRSNAGSDECIEWALSSDNKTLTKVRQFTVTSISSNVQHIAELEKKYTADTFITFHHVTGDGAIGMTRPSIGNDFALTLSNINNDIYSVVDSGMAGNIDALCLKVSYKYYISPEKDFLTVGENEFFTDVAKAVFAACWDEVIHIKKGIYKAQIMAWGKKVHLIGESRSDCIIYDDESDYNNPPIEMNVGSIANLTIKETHANPSVAVDAVLPNGTDRYKMAYCIHAESGNNSQYDTLYIENCELYNSCRPCLGAGLYENSGIKVVNSVFHSGLGFINPSSGKNGLRGALYFHSNTSSTPLNGQNFTAVNCIFICDDITAAKIDTYNGNQIDMVFINNRFLSVEEGETENIILNNEEFGTHLIINDLSFGNNINKLNKE